MLPDGTLHADQIWKRFRADRRGALLRDWMNRGVQRLRGRRTSRWRWALQDINLHIEPGEAVGLIGPNGSGKTTLLKILTGVMYPHSGSLSVAGRVGALIEVRAGIHPLLTGRENIYLYGSLLGHRRAEVARRFDEIVAFAEIEDAIDRQVKFYSSGMQMRLGFSVAAFLEPDVLLVDEVLAVGDTSFQQKCLDRMREVLEQGTTLVFVSHDLAATESVCSRGVLLERGRLVTDGPVRDVLTAYRKSVEEMAEASKPVDGVVRLLKTEVRGPDASGPRSGEQLHIRSVLESPEPGSARVYVGVSEGPATSIFVLRRDISLASGETDLRCTIDHLPLPRGRFYVWLGVWTQNRNLLPWQPVSSFDVSGPELDTAPKAIVRLSPVQVESTWELGSQ